MPLTLSPLCCFEVSRVDKGQLSPALLFLAIRSKKQVWFFSKALQIWSEAKGPTFFFKKKIYNLSFECSEKEAGEQYLSSNWRELDDSVFLRLQVQKTKRQSGSAIYRYSWDCFLSRFVPLPFPLSLWQEIVVFLGKQVCERASAIQSFASHTCCSWTVWPDTSWLQSCSWNAILGCANTLRMRRKQMYLRSVALALAYRDPSETTKGEPAEDGTLFALRETDATVQSFTY